MTVYYEDLEVGRRWRSRAFKVERKEMVAFARQWDPRPFHVDDRAAAETVYGELIASGAFTMAVFLKLGNEAAPDWAMVAALGWDQVRFTGPVKAGDELTAECQVIAKQESKRRPGHGIVRSRQRLINQRGESVLVFTSPLLMEMRKI